MSQSAVGARRAEVVDGAPRFRCGDDIVTTVYRHRWESFAHHVARSQQGWVITEFRQPGPGRAYGTVNAAAGHHIREARWLRQSEIVADYIRFWYADPAAEPNRYTEWIAWATREFARLRGEWDLASEVLPGMVRVFDAWGPVSRHGSGLYWAHDLADAMEVSISGDGLRPSANSYQYGNADAIAEIARRSGDDETAQRFDILRDQLRRLVIDHLYDSDSGFFRTVPMSATDLETYAATAGVERRMPPELRDAPLAAQSDLPPDRAVRELIGYVPWYVGLPGTEIDPGPAVSLLADPDGFAAPFGLRTAERRHPRYRQQFPDAFNRRFLCQWNGPVWPFATSQALTALGNIARLDGARNEAGALFVTAFRQFAASHLGDDGEYLLDEYMDPDTGRWSLREWRLENEPHRAQIGTDYNHSTFADLVLSGLLGIDSRDGDVVVDPLVEAAELGWFEVHGLTVVGQDVSVRWSPGDGLFATVGALTAHRPDLGPLRVRAVDSGHADQSTS